MGSVKDLAVVQEPVETGTGVGRFCFSDRYSVFDWGEMPDHIENKGKAICIAAAHFFERLEGAGVRTHYRGVVEDGFTKRLRDLKKAQNTMEFQLLRVVKPRFTGEGYDYSVYKEMRENFLIPLEIIYRNSLPAGSSVFRRLREGELKPEEIGLDQIPEPGTVLAKPILDVSTKLEVSDRYLTWAEAQMLCHLSDSEIEGLQRLTMLVNNLITEEVKKVGLFNEDGKVEFGFDADRCLMVVDAVGTLDECRFTYHSLPVSKEIARIYYRKTDWYQAVETAKKRDRTNWKEICPLKPERLPEELRRLISQIYTTYTNELTGREWFLSVPPLGQIMDELKGFLVRVE